MVGSAAYIHAVRGNLGLVAFIAMAIASFVRIVYYFLVFRADGHRYRIPRFFRSLELGSPSQCCEGCCVTGMDDSDRQFQPLQPVTSRTQLLAQRKLEIHLLVFAAMCMEIPVFACGTTGDMVGLKRLYPLHMAAFLLLYGAFAMLVTIW